MNVCKVREKLGENEIAKIIQMISEDCWLSLTSHLAVPAIH
jgi:hypothetical protein